MWDEVKGRLSRVFWENVGPGKPLCTWQWPLVQLILGIKAPSHYGPPTMTGDQAVRNLTAIINTTVELPHRYSSEFPTCPCL